MKLFIGNKYNLKLYIIPKVIEDSYLIKYHSSIDNTEKNINLININNKIALNNNLNLNLYEDDKSKESIELVAFKNYKIFINDTEEELFLYCLPDEIEYKDYKIETKRLKIGQSPNNEISIKDNMLRTYFIEIIQEEDNWIVKSDKIPFYINKNKTNYAKINYGDELFIAGFKIIWLKGFIRANNHPNVNVYLPEYDVRLFSNTYKEPIKLQDFESNKALEEPEPEEEIETITLENPPLKEKNNDLYYFIALGSSFTLAITSVATLLTIFLAIASGSSSLREEKNLLIISVILIFFSILFPFLIKQFQKNSNERKEGKRILQYSEYLKSQKAIISEAISKRANNLKKQYPSSKEWQERIQKNKIWTRTIENDNFLKISFGIGDIAANIAIDSHKLSFTYENPILKEQLTDIQNSSLTMKKVPIPISLITNKLLPVIINEDNYKDYIDMILVQLISFYSNSNLKIVFFVSEENRNIWNNYKYIPHIYDNQNEIRLFAYDKNDTNNIISFIEETYQTRIQKLKNTSINTNNKEYYTSFNEYYLIITDKYQDLSSYEIINKILTGNNYGFSILSFEKNSKNNYNDFKTFLEVKGEHITSSGISSDLVIPGTFQVDYNKNIDIYNIVKTIANLPIITHNNKVALPKEISLLEMYKVGMVEQLNILDRWKNNNTVLSLGAPIGVSNNNEVVELNLHEKYQGPNAIVAGTVGSGKLELLKTYIASMCINYSPEDIQFVLIDYKNSGLIKTFIKNQKVTPHIVGSLKDLDSSELYRLYTLLKTEINRRKEVFTNIQKKLGDTSMNIYKYKKLHNEGVVTDPIAHLFIVFYEYAELYNQYPESFNELINLIYSANSYGLHLILATQKPSEVLDNQIIRNSRLKICLKVQSLRDSEEVLKRREAASIDNPGRFYYEIGYNESFKQVQCANSNILYNPQEVYQEKIDDSLSFITDSGIIYKEVNEDRVNINNRYGLEIDNVIDYLGNLCEDLTTEKVFLPSLEENLSLSKLIRKYKYKTTNYQFNAIVGEYDKPSKKEQNILTIDLENSDNIIIYGMPGTGKSSHISTILFSICIFHSPKEVNIYIFDNKDESLKSFGKMPQVGEYTSGYDSEKAESLLAMLKKEMKKRKNNFKEYHYSFVENNANSPYKAPLILIAIRDYKKFLDNNKDLEEKYNALLKEGPSLGIIFITSVTEASLISKDTSSSFKTILGTQFADSFDYRYLLDAPKGLIPKKCYGRGLTKISDEIVEYQNAFIACQEEVDKVILENAVELKNNYKTKVKPILVNLMAGDKKNEK